MADTAPRRCRVCGHFEPHLREHYDAHAASAQDTLTRCAGSDVEEAERARRRITNCERFKEVARRAPRVRRGPPASRAVHSFRAPSFAARSSRGLAR